MTISFDDVRKQFPEGTRVRFKWNEERFPHFIVPEGTTGTVVDASEESSAVFVRVDQFVAGLSDNFEWRGEFAYSWEDAEHDDEVPFEHTDVPQPEPYVVAAVPEERDAGLTVGELIEVLQQLDKNAPVQMTAIIDGEVVTTELVQGVRAFSEGPRSVDLVGSDTYRPEQLYDLP